MVMVVAVLFSSPPAQAQEEAPPAAHSIDSALMLHVSSEGFRAIGNSIGRILPTSLLATGLGGEFDCGELGDDDSAGTGDDDSASSDLLQYSAEDILLRLTTDEVSFTPADNRLDVVVAMTLYSDPASLSVQGPCLVDLDEQCVLALQPTPLNANITIQFALSNGELQAQIESLSFSYGNFGNPVGTDCVLGDAIAMLQGYGVDLLGGLVGSAIDGQVTELEAQLSSVLNSLTETLNVQETITAVETELDFSLEPSSFQLDSTGMLIHFSTRTSASSYGPCVDASPAYVATSHDVPALTGLLPDNVTPYHVAAALNQDALNQALYAAWQGGALCLSLSDLTDQAITTDYLALVEQDLVDELWPDAKPLDVRAVGETPPTATFSYPPSVSGELSLDVYGEELDRITRYFANGLFAEVGLSLTFAEQVLDLEVHFDRDSDLGVTVSYNEWLPSAIPEGFGRLIPEFMDEVFDPDVLAPSITLPAIYGLTLSDLEVQELGSKADFIGVYTWLDDDEVTPLDLGTVDLAGVGCGDTSDGGDITVSGCANPETGCGAEGFEIESGCDAESGCDGVNCSSSCEDGACTTSQRMPSSALLTFLVVGLALARRRR